MKTFRRKIEGGYILGNHKPFYSTKQRTWKLLPQEIIDTLPPYSLIYDDNAPPFDDLMVHCKFDSPQYTWYVICGQPENNDFIMFCYVLNKHFKDCSEAGDVFLSQLEDLIEGSTPTCVQLRSKD
jgi:hypothetical protein